MDNFLTAIYNAGKAVSTRPESLIRMDGLRFHLLSFLTDSQEQNLNRHGYWVDNMNQGEILCKTEDAANHLANFLEDLGFGDVTTGYYDPIQDELNDCVDRLTGFYYVEF